MVKKASSKVRGAWVAPFASVTSAKLLVEEEDEKVDIDFGLVEEFHDSHTLILELQEVLIVKLKSLHVHTQELGIYFKLSCLISRGDVKMTFLK